MLALEKGPAVRTLKRKINMDVTAGTMVALTMCSSSRSNLRQRSRVVGPYNGATSMATATEAKTTALGSTIAATTMAKRATQPTTAITATEAMTAIDGMRVMTKQQDPMRPLSLDRLLILVNWWTLKFNKMREFKNKVSSLMIKQWD